MFQSGLTFLQRLIVMPSQLHSFGDSFEERIVCCSSMPIFLKIDMFKMIVDDAL